ncbi:type II secretion system F family protein [Candidatus Woesearchaeota archaeon]|nr:type II secretion system F family protein [Candidatus Woesearchaeota archaeon]
MALISHNLNTNILFAIEYSVILLDSGYSRENILSNLAGKSFGKISSFANKSLRSINKGSSYQDALLLQQNRERHSSMKRFISIFNSDQNSDIRPMLNDLSDQVMKQKNLSAETLVDNLTSKLQKSMTISAIPIFIFFVILLQNSLEEMIFIPRPELDYLLYGVTVVLLIIILLRSRYNED